jgi:hypothetical protein
LFSGLINFILQATHKSLSINYAQLRAAFSPMTNLPLVSKQALSKVRQGISYTAFLALLRISVEQYYQHLKDLRLWNGFHIYAVDGSTIQIPDSIENVESFGGNPNKTGKLSPLASVSVLYDVMNDILVDVTLNACRYNERIPVKEHILFLPSFSNSIYCLIVAILPKSHSDSYIPKAFYFLCACQKLLKRRSLRRTYTKKSSLYLGRRECGIFSN